MQQIRSVTVLIDVVVVGVGGPWVGVGVGVITVDATGGNGAIAITVAVGSNRAMAIVVGFSWVPGALKLVAEDQIALTARFGPLLSSSGTFHKHKVGEGVR